MNAALLETWNNLTLTQLDKPEPDKDHAVVRVLYGGVCGSDITVFSGLHPTAVAPVVLCHEILGHIDMLPNGYAGEYQLGDRVIMNPVISCGQCEACRNGYENVCLNLRLMGIHINGGFAEYVRVPIKNMVKVDDTIPDMVAALSEPFAVAYHVCRRAEIGNADSVLVAGAGTIGLTVALAARELGAGRVIVSEINPKRIELAKAFKLETINPMETDLLAFSGALAGGPGFHIVCDASGAKSSVAVLPDLCRPGGRLVSLSLSGAMFDFPVGKVSFKELTMIGSRLYSHDDFLAGASMLRKLYANADIAGLVTDVMPLQDLQEAIEMMKNGVNTGKILIKCNED